MPVLEVQNLKKYYGNHRGVDDVSFSVNEGEIFGFIGPNGAGKSTTIRCALSLIFPTEGEIRIFGLDAIKDRVEIAKHIGYLPSEVFYYDNMKVHELLEYSASFYEHVDAAYTQELCDLLELDRNKRIDELSFGNKKKVGIVQGLQHRPRLIMLDEPTSGLDPLMQHRFFDLIESHRENGATIFFSSHILSEVKRLCDRIAIIRQGRVEDVNTVLGFEANLYKHIELTAPETRLQALDPLDGLVVTRQSEGFRQYDYRGDIQALLPHLVHVEATNLTITDPSLEDIFMRYYEGGDHDLSSGT